jgi:hypothetical protein
MFAEDLASYGCMVADFDTWWRSTLAVSRMSKL